MEKIREAMAKARMDKTFREQHPVSAEAEDEQSLPDEANPQETTPQEAKPADTVALPVPSAGFEASLKPDPVSANSDDDPPHGSDAPKKIDAYKPGSVKVTKHAQPVEAEVVPSEEDAPDGSLEEQASVNKDTAGAETVDVVSGEADRTAPQEKPVDRKRRVRKPPTKPFWGRAIRLVAIVWTALLIVAWGVHTFVVPLDPYLSGVVAVVDQVSDSIGGAAGPAVDGLLATMSEAWLALVEQIQELTN